MGSRILTRATQACKPVLLALGFTWVMLGAAWAQAPNCAPYDEVTKQLRENYGERLIGQGTMQGGQLIHQVFVNPETRTWTVVILTTGKRACVVATGENWMIPSVAEPEGAPS